MSCVVASRGVAHTLLGQVLLRSAELAASVMDNITLATKWSTAAETLKVNVNQHLWDEEGGMYRDNTTSTLLPQDGNSLALLFNLTTSQAQKGLISAGLQKNWGELGGVGPELPDIVAPFVSGFEVCFDYLYQICDIHLVMTSSPRFKPTSRQATGNAR